MQAFVRSEAEHQLEDVGIRGNALAMRHGGHEAGGCQNFEALIDADEKFGRNDLALDSAELHTLGLACDSKYEGAATIAG